MISLRKDAVEVLLFVVFYLLLLLLLFSSDSDNVEKYVKATRKQEVASTASRRLVGVCGD